MVCMVWYRPVYTTSVWRFFHRLLLPLLLFTLLFSIFYFLGCSFFRSFLCITPSIWLAGRQSVSPPAIPWLDNKFPVLVWMGLGSAHLIGLDRIGLHGMDWNGIGLDWIGVDWIGVDRAWEEGSLMGACVRGRGSGQRAAVESRVYCTVYKMV